MFSRPVETSCPITCYYGEKHPRFTWSLDPDNRFWIPVRGSDSLGQHRGTDFDCPVGTVVRAMSDGLIIRARYENNLNQSAGAGYHILQLVTMPGYDSWILKYAHLSKANLVPGARVVRGDPIGQSGQSGAVDRPYLHVDLMNLRRQWEAIPFES